MGVLFFIKSVSRRIYTNQIGVTQTTVKKTSNIAVKYPVKSLN